MKSQKHLLYYSDSQHPIPVYLGSQEEFGPTVEQDRGDLEVAWREHADGFPDKDDSSIHITRNGTLIRLEGLRAIVPAQPEDKVAPQSEEVVQLPDEEEGMPG